MIGTVVPIVIGVVGFLGLISTYRIVAPSEAHVVVTPRSSFVCSPDVSISGSDGSRWYFNIPFLRTIRVLDMNIKEFKDKQLTYEKDQGRYNVTTSTKYRISDARKAAEKFVSDSELKEQLKEIIQSAVRAVTIKHSVEEARAEKETMSNAIEKQIAEDMKKYGIIMESFQLVDFEDTPNSTIISNISERREKEVEALTRQQLAEKEKEARIKEAEADEAAQLKEITRDEVVAKRKEDQKKAVAIQAKEATEQELEVTKVEQVKNAEIQKQKAEVQAEQAKAVAIIKAEQDRDAEEIIKQQKRLAGEGDRLKAEENAKAEAAPIREKGNAEAEIIKLKGIAEAEAKEKLQAALNKFKPEAITALTAELIVAKDKEIGVELAKAYSGSDIKVFAGSGEGKNGFDFGQMLEALKVSNPAAAKSVLHQLEVPNDLGFGVNQDLVEKVKKIAGNK